MPLPRLFLVVCFLAVSQTFAQQNMLFPQASGSAQASALLAQSSARTSGGLAISDATVTGTAVYYGGGSPESGPATLTAVGEQKSQVIITLPSGTVNEIRTVSGGVPLGSGSGPKGVSYTIAERNLLTSAAWFFPFFLTNSAGASSAYASAYVAREENRGVAVHHIRIWRQPDGASADEIRALQQLSVEEVYLDASTLLPVAVTFRFADLPIEVRFSDYRQVQGRTLAYRIQLYMRSILRWDIQASAININTGAVISRTQANLPQ